MTGKKNSLVFLFFLSLSLSSPSSSLPPHPPPLSLSLSPGAPRPQAGRLWPRPRLRPARPRLHPRGRHALVPRARDPARREALLDARRCVVDRLHLRRDGQRQAAVPGGLGDRRAVQDLQAAGHARRRVMAGRRRAAGLQGQLPEVAPQEPGRGRPGPRAGGAGPAGRDAAVRAGGQAHGEGGAVAPVLCRHRERGEGGERRGHGGEYSCCSGAACCCCCCCWRRLWTRGRCSRARCRSLMMATMVERQGGKEERRGRGSDATFRPRPPRGGGKKRSSFFLHYLPSSRPFPASSLRALPISSPRSALGNAPDPFFFPSSFARIKNERHEKKNKKNAALYFFFSIYPFSGRKKNLLSVFPASSFCSSVSETRNGGISRAGKCKTKHSSRGRPLFETFFIFIIIIFLFLDEFFFFSLSPPSPLLTSFFFFALLRVQKQSLSRFSPSFSSPPLTPPTSLVR